MSKRLSLRWWASLFLIMLFCVCLGVTKTYAETLQSASYHIDESAVGVGDISQGASASYQAAASIGDLAVGNSASDGYQINSGSQTTSDPALSFFVDDSNLNFGDFTPTDPTTTTTTFSVSNYTAYGYVVQIYGTPPTYGSHVITPMTETDGSQNGIDQFGINLVANTSPTSLGANPDNGQFGYGSVNLNYSTPNKYRFVSGETIASAPKSSGKTIYTISYIVNVSNLTPGGVYRGNQNIIVIGTY